MTAATLTSVAVFFPMVFITGIAGQLFKDQSLTVTFALAFSLVVALTLVPMLAAGRARAAAAAAGSRARAASRRPRRARGCASCATARAASAAGSRSGCALALSPLVRVTQAVNRWADRTLPGRDPLGARAPGQDHRLGRGAVRVHDGADRCRGSAPN